MLQEEQLSSFIDLAKKMRDQKPFRKSRNDSSFFLKDRPSDIAFKAQNYLKLKLRSPKVRSYSFKISPIKMILTDFRFLEDKI